MDIGYYAKINEENIVVDVIRCSDEIIESGQVPGKWVKTSYNTKNGVHTNGKTPIRANYAGIGYIYDEVNDVFIPPKPQLYPSWILNPTTFTWEPPIMCPNLPQKLYEWDENNQTWLEFDALEEDA